MNRQIKAIGLGDSLVNYESKLIEDFKSKLDKIDAKLSLYQSTLDKFNMTTGEDYSYLNVNRWIIRSFTDKGYSGGYVWYRVLPVIGGHVYCGYQTMMPSGKSAPESGSYYMKLKRLQDVSSPTKLSSYINKTNKTVQEYLPGWTMKSDVRQYVSNYGANITESTNCLEDEIILKTDYAGFMVTGNSSATYQTLPHGLNSLVMDFRSMGSYMYQSYFYFDQSATIKDRYFSFEIVNYGREEQKYLQGLIVILCGHSYQWAGYHNSITLMNGEVNIGEITTEISPASSDEIVIGKVLYITLNPLIITSPWQLKK